jgi:hypothetical protein
LYAIVYLPGTFVHELSHFLFAKALFVKVGKFSVKPRKLEEEIVLGSVSIEKVDIIRRLIIGSSPVVFGLTIILSAIYFVLTNNIYRDLRVALLMSYVVFVIGNTMFSSRKDVEGIWKVAVSAVIIFLAFYILGVRFYMDFQSVFLVRVIEIVKVADIYLVAPLAVDLIISACYSLKNKIF